MRSALPLRPLLIAVSCVPALAIADSQLVSSGAATAHLDFRVVIPRVLYLAVGSTGSTVDTVTFDLSDFGAVLGTGAQPPASRIGNKVPVKVWGNNGGVSLTASTVGPLTNEAGDTIAWSEITATTSDNSLPSPVIPATGTGVASNVAPNAGSTKITRREAVWTFSYLNSQVLPPGTYGTATNGRVTYTASMP